MLLIVENVFRGGKCNVVDQYVKVKNRYKKYYDNNKESSYFKYQDKNNLYWCAMSQILSEDDSLHGDFKQVEETSQFNEDFIKSQNKDCDIGYFFEFDVQYPDELQKPFNDLAFLTFQNDNWKS